jgi:hypothetical protein
MSDQQPWQRDVRHPDDRQSWGIEPGVETPRRYQPGPAPPEPSSTGGSRDGAPRAEWKASASFGRLIGLLLIAGAALLAVVCVLRARDAAGTERAGWFVAFIVATMAVGLLGYLYRGIGSITYTFGADDLVVSWLSQRHVVRLAEIERVVWEPRRPAPWRGLEPIWPGYYVSTRRTPEGVWRSWATQSPQRRIRLVTASEVVAISPERPILFLAELARRRQRVVVEPVFEPVAWSAVDRTLQPDVYPETASPQTPDVGPAGAPSSSAAQTVPRPALRPLWLYAWDQLFRGRLLHDEVASSLIAAGVALPLLMFAYLFSQYEGLLDQVPLHWDAHGRVDRVGQPSDLWKLPLMAVVLLVINTALATLLIALDRYLARLMTAATPIAQAVIFVALIRAVS